MSVDRLHSDSTGSARSHGSLAFSTPMGVSATAVLAALIIGALLLFGPRGRFGLGLSPTTEPSTPAPVASADATATPEATPSHTLAPTPTATPQPTPTPVAVWTGLEWSGPITPSIFVADAIWWNDRYVGAGYVAPEEYSANGMPTHVPVFLESSDGVTWDVVQELASYAVGDDGGGPYPANIVPVGGGRLLAMGGYTWGGGPPALWESPDGQTWTAIDSPSWRSAWGSAHAIGIAGSAMGAVAIGAEGPGCCANSPGQPIVLHSLDGHAWQLVTPSSPEPSVVRDVASYAGGFVVTGRVGERDDFAAQFVGTGTPAVWVSPDGVDWAPAAVEGAEAVRGGLVYQVATGDDGLFAIGNAQPVAQYSDAAVTGWSSSDGRVWTRLGELGEELPSVRVLTSDGTRMVILGPESSSTLTLAGWTSFDGARWTPLQFSGAPAPAADLPHGPVAGVSGALKYQMPSEWPPTRLLRDGAVAYGWVPVGSTWEDGTAGAAWVATAIER